MISITPAEMPTLSIQNCFVCPLANNQELQFEGHSGSKKRCLHLQIYSLPDMCRSGSTTGPSKCQFSRANWVTYFMIEDELSYGSCQSARPSLHGITNKRLILYSFRRKCSSYRKLFCLGKKVSIWHWDDWFYLVKIGEFQWLGNEKSEEARSVWCWNLVSSFEIKFPPPLLEFLKLPLSYNCVVS